MLIDDLLQRLPNEETLQNVLLCNILDENTFEEGLSMEENGRRELEGLSE